MYAFMVAKFNFQQALRYQLAVWIDNEAARYAIS